MDYKLYDKWLIKNGRKPDLVFPVYEEDIPEGTKKICEDINTITTLSNSDFYADTQEHSMELQNQFFDARHNLYRLAEIVGVMSQLFNYKVVENRYDDGTTAHVLILSDKEGLKLLCYPITELEYIILKERDEHE